MDALSDVLKAVRLTGAVFFDVEASAPWVAASPAGAAIVGSIFPGSDHLISYHVVTRGSAWACLDGVPAIALGPGDVVMFPHGDKHLLTSTPGLRQSPDLALFRRPEGEPLPFSLSLTGEGRESAHVVCGFLGCDARPFNPLLEALPRVIHLAGTPDGALATFVQFAAQESRAERAGRESVLSRLSEMLFIDVVRRHIESLDPEQRGWLAGLREPAVGRALTALHREPSRPWTLDVLAREAGLSRSGLAERFTQYVGQPPMQYLANWRMQLAAHHLRDGGASVADVADRVGYASEAAFSRAFKKAVGVPPGQWRRTS